jgi:dihydroflavonol-4-reductase
LIAPRDWPILVTGAGGFVGGHIARRLAQAGHAVRGLSRRPIEAEAGDPSIDWQIGDLRDPTVRKQAVAGVRAVVHSASWVSLGSDPNGHARSTNIDATRHLLTDAEAAGIERFIYTSTLHTLAAGTPDAPADEQADWNLHRVDSPYARSKREAERIVLGGSDRLAGVVLCPGMALGPRDVRPTSTRLLLAMAATPVAILPRGGIPIVDASVLAQAHCRAIHSGEPGRRYAVVGPYMSYPELAAEVGRLAGRPWRIVTLPDAVQGPVVGTARLIDKLVGGRWLEVSAASAAGGFLQLHVSGALADATFDLTHPPAIDSIFAALDDHRRSGRAPWLSRLKPPVPVVAPISQ